jgi:hypothetical protein
VAGKTEACSNSLQSIRIAEDVPSCPDDMFPFLARTGPITPLEVPRYQRFSIVNVTYDHDAQQKGA